MAPLRPICRSIFHVEVTQSALGSMTLSWTAPTENTDGSQLNDLAGYKLYYGTSAGNYTKSGTRRQSIDQHLPGREPVTQDLLRRRHVIQCGRHRELLLQRRRQDRRSNVAPLSPMTTPPSTRGFDTEQVHETSHAVILLTLYRKISKCSTRPNQFRRIPVYAGVSLSSSSAGK